MNLSLGVIGCGAVATAVHFPRLAQLPELFSVSAVCDVDPIRLAQAPSGARAFSDPEELLNLEGLDAVAILTPTHGALLEKALDRGLDVFVEKPLCEDPVQARRLVTRAREAGRIVKVGTMREHDAAITAARRLLDEIAPIRWVELRDLCGGGSGTGPGPMTSLHPALPTVSARDRNALQTALIQMVHDLSILRALFAAPLQLVHATTSADGWVITGEITIATTEPLRCMFGVAEYGVNRRGGFDQRVTVIGERGTLELRFDDAAEPALPTIGLRDDVERIRSCTDTYLEEWRDLHAAIQHRRTPVGTIEHAAADVELLFAAALGG